MEKREFLSLLGSAPAAVLAAFSRPAPGPRARQLPNFALTTHEAKQVRFYDDLLRGKLATSRSIAGRYVPRSTSPTSSPTTCSR